MSDVAIRVENLSKQYKIGKRERYQALRDTLTDAIYAPFRRVSALIRPSLNGNEQRPAEGEHIWALKDVSFEVKRGEVVGIIGRNGVGKTTLLKILSRITEPTHGYAEVRGRVGSLLEVGTGFHPEMTGRENIYLNGAILGMRHAEIERKFDEIVSFAGVERFIDTPVKRYSSGMYVRLAFAVAAHLEPEILLVDEVLSVGDAYFQEKCLGRMSQVAGSGRTVLFVSHNMAAVRSLCTRAVLLDNGVVRLQDGPDAVISEYLSTLRSSDGATQIALTERCDRSGSGTVRVVSFQARAAGTQSDSPRTGSDAEFIVGYAASEGRDLVRLHVGISVMDVDGVNVFGCTTRMRRERDFRDVAPFGQITCRIKGLPLIPGKYWANILLKDEWGLADWVNKAASFPVIDDGTGEFLVFPSRGWGGNVVVRHEWDLAPFVHTMGGRLGQVLE